MKTHISLNADHLIHNLKTFHEISGKPLMFVVKANAYGHGLEEIVTISRELPYIHYYAVDSCAEAEVVRRCAPAKKILILGWSDDDELKGSIEGGFELVISSTETLMRVEHMARSLGKPAHGHYKLETGTSRLGMQPEDFMTAFTRQSDWLTCRGVYSHFANIEDTTDHTFAEEQLRRFHHIISQLKQPDLVRHFSCSASTLLFPETHFDMVRIGISAYGYWPSKQTYISYIEQNGSQIELKPVLAWQAKVAQVKKLEKGQYIGYGLTYQTFNPTIIAVVPVGYFDGYDRRFSNVATVLVNGVRAPVRGRVCMDMFMVEITHIPDVKEGDTVTLIGRGDEEGIDAEALAEIASTIHYEVLSRINPGIPRLILPQPE